MKAKLHRNTFPFLISRFIHEVILVLLNLYQRKKYRVNQKSLI